MLCYVSDKSRHIVRQQVARESCRPHNLQEIEVKEKQAKKIYEKEFAGTKIPFSHYYKYAFTYIGEANGMKLIVVYGGNSADIYRAELSNFETLPMNLEELKEEYRYITLRNIKTKESYDWYE
jgi:hypothetical protein